MLKRRDHTLQQKYAFQIVSSFVEEVATSIMTTIKTYLCVCEKEREFW
jgi:hypothetical protein